MKNQSVKNLALGALLGLAGWVAGPATAQAAEVNVYSYREAALLKPLLEAFTGATGIKANLVSVKEDALLERMKSEGENSPADVLMTVDVIRLVAAKEAGLFRPIAAPAIERAVAPEFRDPEGHWFALSIRARPIMYAKDRVKPAELSSYEALADAAWKGRICVRSSSSAYNQALIASLIAVHGVDKTEAWAKGLVGNFARTPKGGDRDQIAAVAAGECDLALANTYYLAGMTASPDPRQKAAAEKVAVFWPNQGDRGAHVNVSGIGVARHAKNPEHARRLVEFLVSVPAQRIYAERIEEYPIARGVEPSATLSGWGKFKADTTPLAAIARHGAEAIRLADRAGWR
ncbi:MAG: Fe(3+) ABC transporter substrate-binding protein [Alphaproteobacteria bacterium]|nr:Fe(3+) ABC transporter substrate-binding protein [Alphaproteobacteria bacterium]